MNDETSKKPPQHAESINPVTGDVEHRRLSLREILERCAELGACTPEDIRGKSLHKSIREARVEYYARAHEAGYSWTEIGRYVGKQHTTCMKSVSNKARRLGVQQVLMTPTLKKDDEDG